MRELPCLARKISPLILGAYKKPKNQQRQLLGELLRTKVMADQSGKDTQRMIRAIAVLLRNTTWKCGKVERLVVNYLREKIRKCGRARTPIKEMLHYFMLNGKQKSEFLDAIKRLEKRRIIKIEGF